MRQANQLTVMAVLSTNAAEIAFEGRLPAGGKPQLIAKLAVPQVTAQLVLISPRSVAIPDQPQALLTNVFIGIKPQVIRRCLTTIPFYFSGSQAARIFSTVVDGIEVQAQTPRRRIPAQLASEAVGVRLAVLAIAL